MFTISVETYFWASHSLALPNGKKEKKHHHNWRVTADVSSQKLNDISVVMDFNDLKAVVDNIVAEIAGKDLGKNKFFQENNSSAEIVAKYVYEKLELKLPKGVVLEAVRVMEQPGCEAKFSK